jgi:hypothetical protein
MTLIWGWNWGFQGCGYAVSHDFRPNTCGAIWPFFNQNLPKKCEGNPRLRYARDRQTIQQVK